MPPVITGLVRVISIVRGGALVLIGMGPAAPAARTRLVITGLVPVISMI
ncbi:MULTISPECIES: hypothetical protein [Microvirga]|nr:MULTISPECIES: hypothetical protein [unclassified Microvirga]